MIIVDASVAVRWYARDAWTELADALAERSDLTAPDLIVYELSNALWKIARAGSIPDVQASDGLKRLPGAVDLVSAGRLAPRAFAIARILNHATYDCFYLALSETLQAPFVTLDRELFNRTRGTPWAGLTTLLGGEPALT